MVTQSLKVLLPYVGALIGPGGSTINAIRTASRARIHIGPLTTLPTRVVSVVGDEKAVRNAMALMAERIEEEIAKRGELARSSSGSDGDDEQQ